MKRILQKTLGQLRMLLLMAVMFVAGGSAWAEDWQTVQSNSFDENSGFTIINANNDSKTWVFNSSPYYYIRYDWNSANAADDYCVFDAVELVQGATYRVTVQAKNQGTSYNEKMRVVYGSYPTAGSLTTVIIETTELSGDKWTELKGTFTVPSSGNYYIALHAVSDRDKYYLYADDYKLEVDEETLGAPNVYPVVVNGGVVGGGVIYNGVTYDDEIQTRDNLTLGDVTAKKVDGYDAEITFDGETFTVTYTALPTVTIGANATDSEGNYWTSFCYKKPVSFAEGVTPCIVTGADNGVLTVQEHGRFMDTFVEPLDFTTNKVGNPLTFLNGNLTLTSNGWNFATGFGYAECVGVNDDNDLSSITLTLDENFNGIIKKVTYERFDGSTSGEWFNGMAVSEIIVNAKTTTITCWRGPMIRRFLVEIEEETVPIFPANTGILVKSTEAKAVNYTVHEVSEVNVDDTDNLLVGCTADATWNEDGKRYYKFSLDADNTAGTAGFYWGVDDGASIEAHAGKAYLVLGNAAASNSRFLINGFGEETGIEAVATESNDVIYNLQGQRVNATKAGIYVKNGKKFIVK